MRKIIPTMLVSAFLFANYSSGQSNYAPNDVHRLFAARGRNQIYFSTGEMSIHAEYSQPKGKPVLFIQGLRNSGLHEKYRGLQPNDPGLKARFKAASDDDLMIRVCGDRIGDDECDYFHPIGKGTTIGGDIAEADRNTCYAMVHAIGVVLRQLPGSKPSAVSKK